MNNEEFEQGTSLLKDIIDMVKNPKAIDDAYERRRKAEALTLEEANKAIEARILIGRADSLRKELGEREAALELKKAEHNKATDELQKEKDAVALREKEVLATTARQEETDKKHIEIKAQLEADALQLKSIHEARSVSLDARENAIKEKDALSEQEKSRLADWEKKLKEKANKLAAMTADW